MPVSASPVVRIFNQAIDDATKAGSGRAWLLENGDQGNGSELNPAEAKGALAKLASAKPEERVDALKNVMREVNSGALQLGDEVRAALIKAYLKSQPRQVTRMSGWAARAGLAPAIAKPAFIFMVEKGTGGASTICARALVDNEASFVKSQQGSVLHRTRHAVFEGDILAGQLFHKVGLLAPQSRVIDVSALPELADSFGKVCLDMELVNPDSVGSAVTPGFFRDIKDIDVDAFLKMLVVDLIIGNGDRRHANFFVTQKDRKLVPIPIDNNAAFLTGLTNTDVTSHCNFTKSFGGGQPLGSDLAPHDIGSVELICEQAESYRLLLNDERARARLPAIIDEVVKTLDDKFFGDLVDALPREIVPRGLKVQPWDAGDGADRSDISAEWQQVFDRAWQHVPEQGLSGRALYDARKRELKDTFAWRRDHVKDALLAHLAANPVKAED